MTDRVEADEYTALAIRLQLVFDRSRSLHDVDASLRANASDCRDLGAVQGRNEGSRGVQVKIASPVRLWALRWRVTPLFSRRAALTFRSAERARRSCGPQPFTNSRDIRLASSSPLRRIRLQIPSRSSS